VHAEDEVVDLGRAVSLTGIVAGSEDCRSGADVRIVRRIGDTVENVGNATADANGSWRAKISATRNAAYSVEIATGGRCGSATSDEVIVKVRAAVDALVMDRRVGAGKCARVKGRVAPNKAGAPVWLQQRIGGRWRAIDSDTLSGRSRFSFPACFDEAGRKTLRVKWSADGANAASASPTLRVKVVS
jgi:hypothetical protein